MFNLLSKNQKTLLSMIIKIQIMENTGCIKRNAIIKGKISTKLINKRKK